MGIRNLVTGWGSTAEERTMPLPCDEIVPDARLVLHRAVHVDAPPETVFRWLCQLRAAPYSYDLIDNLGRRSPRHLTPGLAELEVGQRFAPMFELVAFKPNVHITIWAPGSLFGDVAGTYRVRPDGKGGS